ncbi:flagellar radial spoke [Raphidocelis subcapitata]|uniref:Flagellar radial spoke n=1 Tax=Raphidocelis subcapitata TaxID=307507 RepID=A0A2V0PPV5_9CHLO|nr:flagellar radial spoke [Raphidocelis subcapitata]|eukprot:GBF99225.1 flagellar radial spoke [Raphidocelis subcapitata]
MAGADVEEALAFVQRVPTTARGSLYEQLTHLVAKVLEQRPADAVDVLETALLAKKTGAEPAAKEVAAAAAVPPEATSDAAKARATASLYGSAEAPIDPDTGDALPLEPPNDYEAEDTAGDGGLFEAIGAGLGRAETVDVALAAKRLGQDPRLGVATVRFFGKFLGTHADYYVFETTLQNPPAEPEEQQPEGEAPLEWNSGANGYVYFAAPSPGGPLTQLPHVTPAQIKAARRIKKLLTGRLGSEVSAYPVFPGKEANYLRAQIARIAATTVLCPVGLFEVNEDGGLDKAEEWEAPPEREMGAPANWAHRYPHLKAQGRCALHRREPPEGEEDTFEYTEEEGEEGPEPLAPAEGDAEVLGGAAWSPLFSSAGEHTKYQAAGAPAAGGLVLVLLGSMLLKQGPAQPRWLWSAAGMQTAKRRDPLNRNPN